MSTAVPPPRDPTRPAGGRTLSAPSAPAGPPPVPAAPPVAAAADASATAPYEPAVARNGSAGPTGPDATATVALHRFDLDPAPDPAPSPADVQHTVPWFRQGTGPAAIAPPRVRHRWRKVIGRTLSKAWGDSLFGMSSQAAFWCALSTAPLLLALLGLVGYVVGWYFPAGTIDQVREQILIFLNAIFNEEVADNLVGNTVETILSQGQADVVSVGLVISLWAGSSAMSAFVESITIAYGQHEVRHPVAERFFALGLYLLALLSGIIMLPLLAIGPDYLPKVFPESWRPQVRARADLRGAGHPDHVPALLLLRVHGRDHRRPVQQRDAGVLPAAAVETGTTSLAALRPRAGPGGPGRSGRRAAGDLAAGRTGPTIRPAASQAFGDQALSDS